MHSGAKSFSFERKDAAISEDRAFAIGSRLSFGGERGLSEAGPQFTSQFGRSKSFPILKRCARLRLKLSNNIDPSCLKRPIAATNFARHGPKVLTEN